MDEADELLTLLRQSWEELFHRGELCQCTHIATKHRVKSPAELDGIFTMPCTKCNCSSFSTMDNLGYIELVAYLSKLKKKKNNP